MSTTPGPWKLATGPYIDNIYGSNGALVVSAETGTDDMILIAAAPDLLTALSDVEQWIVDGMPDDHAHPFLVRIRALIAKARGEK